MSTNVQAAERRGEINRGDLVVAPGVAMPGVERVEPLIQLLRELQSTLEIDGLFMLFARSARRLVAYGGVRYRHPLEGIEQAYGVCDGERFAKPLAVGGEPVGILEFFRADPFGTQERLRLEGVAEMLASPLRNALLYQRAVRSALLDPLTGIHNRGAFDEELRQEVALARRNDTPLSLIVADIDHFKKINDHFGHAIGDCALQSLVECAQLCVRDSDGLYRYGGEEFALLLRDTPLEGACRLAERLRTEVDRRDHECGEVTITMTVSLGVAQWCENEKGAMLFRRADAALYRAKNGGRNRIEVAE